MKSCINFIVKSMVLSGIVLTFTVIAIWGFTELKKIPKPGETAITVLSVETNQVTILLLGVFLFACLSAVVYAFAERGTDNKLLKLSIADKPEDIRKAITYLENIEKKAGQQK
jgi:hypothetical protein